MHTRLDEQLWDRVDAQAQQVPEIYGAIDFSRTPERFTTTLDGEVIPGFEHTIDGVLADITLIDRMAAYTMMGDPVADAYAALMPRFGFHGLVTMLVTACDKGLDAVADRPAELDGLVAAIAATPDWIDMDLVEQGARIERNQFAHLVPFAIRGAFLATFMNSYSALPMAQTGQLSDQLAAKRVQDTATFFTLTVMPGALRRQGPAFRAAAMVRLMHAMVRFNVMRKGRWDSAVYGVPIPQVDSMPAGQIGSLLIAAKAISRRRNSFTPTERARIELGRYRCFLLGLPRDLLGTTPEEIMTLMVARQSTLRARFDDATCGDLVRGTLGTALAHQETPIGRIDGRLEQSFARAFFVIQFLRGDTARARAMGVDYTVLDRALALLAAGRIYSRLFVFEGLARLPLVRDRADRYLVDRLKALLAQYGHAEFVSDGESYRAHG